MDMDNREAHWALHEMLLGLICGGAAVWFAMSRKNGGKPKNLMDEYEFDDDESADQNE